nr:cysteine-rich CWC family protein [Variovorax boronicumulans]
MPAAPLPPPPVPDARTCPLCGQANACVMASGDAARAADCWCMRASIGPEVLARVPPDARGLACVCARCAEG